MVFNANFFIFATGFAGMANEIILIYLFQNIFGYIYQKIGLIIALFMIGLALGSAAITLILPSIKRKLVKVVIMLEVSIIFYLAMVVLLIEFLTGHKAAVMMTLGTLETLFYSLVMVSGCLVGAEFPLAGQILFESRKSVGISAGFVDSLDHLGATLGAFCAGVVILPILGITSGLITILMLKFVGLVFIVSASYTQRRLAIK
jgi:spermidine synthase